MSRVITYTDAKTGKREIFRHEKGVNKGDIKIFTTKSKAEKKISQLKQIKKYLNIRMKRIG